MGQTYYILLVLSRVLNKDKDKDLRFKEGALASATPQDFGVDDYLLLNEKAPMLSMASEQNEEFTNMS